MALNVRTSLITIPNVMDPNFACSGSSIQRVYPQTSIINGTQIAGDCNFIWTVPAGCRLDTQASRIVFDVANVCAAGTALVTSAPAVNQPSTFFRVGRFEIEGVAVSTSQHIAQDDTVFKRMTTSQIKLINTAPSYWSDDTTRFNAWQTTIRQKISWLPQCLIAPDMVITENAQCRLNLSVEPNLFTATATPAFNHTAVIGTVGDAVLRFYEVYMILKFVRVDLPRIPEVIIPAYKVTSNYMAVSGQTNANVQFQVPPETYKIIIALQSNAATNATGLVATKFSSGTGAAAGPLSSQSIYSSFLNSLQLRYAGNTYPNSPYGLMTNTVAAGAAPTQLGDTDGYYDWLAAIDGYDDPSGGAEYQVWADPCLIADKGLGRLFAFNIIKNAADRDTTAEVQLAFSTAPTTTNVWIFAISKVAYELVYGPQNKVEEVKVRPFSGIVYHE